MDTSNPKGPGADASRADFPASHPYSRTSRHPSHVVLGDQSLLIQCCEIRLERGHRLLAGALRRLSRRGRAQAMAGWSDRHWAGRSNPWCVYSRLAAALGLIWAVYSVRDLGLFALVPIGLCLLFIIVNPFVFAAPRDDSRWATRAVLGQRLWRARPRHWRLFARRWR